MKVQKRNFELIQLSDFDMKSLDEVYRMISDLQDMHSNGLYLESFITGECIDIEELARVKGILNFLNTPNQIFRVVEKEKKNTKFDF